jgi:hypothetical protein
MKYEQFCTVFCQVISRNWPLTSITTVSKIPSSETWRPVDFVWTDVSGERIASIFRLEKSASEEPAWSGGCRLNRRFGGTYRLHLQARKIREQETSVSRWLQTVNRRSSETSVHTRFTWSHIPPPWKPQIFHHNSFFINFLSDAFRLPRHFQFLCKPVSVGRLGRLLLVLASTVILGSESSGTHYYILLSHDSGNHQWHSCEL